MIHSTNSGSSQPLHVMSGDAIIAQQTLSFYLKYKPINMPQTANQTDTLVKTMLTDLWINTYRHVQGPSDARTKYTNSDMTFE